jgi:cephalosporin-C deacetylase-like acetyl esterase
MGCKFSVNVITRHAASVFCLVSLCLIPWNARSLNAQQETDVLAGWLGFSNSKSALYNFLRHEANDLIAVRDEKINKIETAGDWKLHQKYVKETLSEIVGPFPWKTELNPDVVRIVEKEGYRIEHIIYESQPGFSVTSSLFIPDGLTGKSPVIILCSGHAPEAYRIPFYLHKIINLVKKGFIVFAFDPVGQGERIEYFNPETGKSDIGGPTSEHSYPGTQAFLSGSSQAMYMIWDGIRAVDYLFTRKEVDTARIGITGDSGGGTQAAYIAAFDDRIHASAPECYITSFRRLFESIGPQDAEQNLYHSLFYGIDHADLLSVRAPKPALMISTTGDFFSIQGARETASEVSRIYESFGSEGNFSMTEDDAGHTSTKKNREAMYSFFQKHLNNPGDPGDLEVNIPSSEEVRVTSTGQVSTSVGGETVFSLNKKYSEGLKKNLDYGRSDLATHLPGVVESAKRISGYRDPGEVHPPVFTGRIIKEDRVIEKYFLQGEGDYVIPYLSIIPANRNGKALLYLHPEGKIIASGPDPDVEWFVHNGFTVVLPDLPGTGETGPGDIRESSYYGGASYNVWFASVLTGRSITGIHAGDITRLARVLDGCPDITGIYALSRREMAPALLHSAAFNGLFKGLAVIEPYSSYLSVVNSRFYEPSFLRSFVAGSLQAYDLPDLAALIAPVRLLIAGMTDGAGGPIDPTIPNNELKLIQTAYEYHKKIDNLIIDQSVKDLYELYYQLLR